MVYFANTYAYLKLILLVLMTPFNLIKQFIEITDMLPEILNQLGAESLVHLKKLMADNSQNTQREEEQVPGINFLCLTCRMFCVVLELVNDK